MTKMRFVRSSRAFLGPDIEVSVMARLVLQLPEGELFGHGHDCNDGTRQRVTMRPSSVDSRLLVADARIRTADQADCALSSGPPDQRVQNSHRAVSRLAYGQRSSLRNSPRP